MTRGRVSIAAAAAGLVLAAPAPALADGAETPQAVAANAAFLSAAPAPPGGAGAVCVIDSGVDTDTDLGPALAERGSVLGEPFGDLGATSDTGVPLPKHGTYVAGVIASQVDGVGSSGIWPASRVVSNRVFTGRSTSAARYINALDWCRQPHLGVKVANVSIAGLEMTAIERAHLGNKIAEMRDVFGINVVAAAGNSGMSNLAYPAAFPAAFAVAATDATGAVARFSNRGPGVDIAALGAGVCVTTPTGHQIGLGEGTSYAAPTVSAVLNALRSYQPSLTPMAAEQLLLESAIVVDGVRVLDARGAFVTAGLAHLVNAYTAQPAHACEAKEVKPADNPPAGGGPSIADADPPAPAPAPIVIAQPHLPAPVVLAPSDDSVAAPAPLRPRLRSLSYRRGILRISIGGMRAGDRAIFVVDHQRYVTRGSTLRTRLPSWREITVTVRRPSAGTSSPLRISRAREFGR